MVKLEEVPDEELSFQQQGPKEEENDWTDDESEISDVDSEDLAFEESFYERISALRDIVPPQYRTSVTSAASSGYSWATSALTFSGKALWVVSTSALLLGVPWALAFSEEQQVQEMEREMRMQQAASEVLTASPDKSSARPAL